MVGWMCTALEIVVYGALAYMTSRMECTISSPPTPKTTAPRICWVSASTSARMNPDVSLISLARVTLFIGR